MFHGSASPLSTSGKKTLTLSPISTGGHLWTDLNIILWQSDALLLFRILTKLYSLFNIL